jgi:PAS domain S-box-containing protein
LTLLGNPLAYRFAGHSFGAFTMGQANPDFYPLILESLPTAVFAVDRDGKIIFWNEGAEKITGHLRQDILGRSCSGEFLEHADANNNPLLGEAIPLIKTMREGRANSGRFSLRAQNGTLSP